jgi:hypothetical protein
MIKVMKHIGEASNNLKRKAQENLERSTKLIYQELLVKG